MNFYKVTTKNFYKESRQSNSVTIAQRMWKLIIDNVFTHSYSIKLCVKFWFLNLNFPLKPEPGLQTGAMNYNVLRLKTVAAIYELFVMKCSAWKSAGFSFRV